ncbi:MAG: hypothetical protein ACP6IP_07945 [Candidatus Njordarchaeia archaeon]
MLSTFNILLNIIDLIFILAIIVFLWNGWNSQKDIEKFRNLIVLYPTLSIILLILYLYYYYYYFYFQIMFTSIFVILLDSRINLILMILITGFFYVYPYKKLYDILGEEINPNKVYNLTLKYAFLFPSSTHPILIYYIMLPISKFFGRIYLSEFNFISRIYFVINNPILLIGYPMLLGIMKSICDNTSRDFLKNLAICLFILTFFGLIGYIAFSGSPLTFLSISSGYIVLEIIWIVTLLLVHRYSEYNIFYGRKIYPKEKVRPREEKGLHESLSGRHYGNLGESLEILFKIDKTDSGIYNIKEVSEKEHKYKSLLIRLEDAYINGKVEYDLYEKLKKEYSRKYRKYKAQRLFYALKKLDELYESGKITKNIYNKLKNSYQRELQSIMSPA